MLEDNKISKETGEFIGKNLKNDALEVIQGFEAKEIQKQKDLRKFIYFFGVAAPLLALLQTIKIFYTQSAVGVSLFYWVAYLIVAALWFGYGLYYKDKPIMISYGLWILVELITLNGIFLYG